MRKLLVFAVLVLFMLSFSVSCKKFSDTDIKFGIIGPMQLSQGNYQWNGATLAAEEINAAGGIKVGAERKKIELIKADSNELTSIPDAVNAMERLITQENADFILGGFRTEAVLAMQDIAMDHKKIFIGVGAAHPE